MSRKRALAHAAGLATVALVVVYAAHRPGHIPPYDANLVRLAETELQGYCAGETFWKTGGGGDRGMAADCRDRERDARSSEINLLAAERAFCQAIVNQGWEGTVSSCLVILSDNKYWPTYDGSISDQWNRARPYPRPAIGGAGKPSDGSRTGGRPSGPGRPTQPIGH